MIAHDNSETERLCLGYAVSQRSRCVPNDGSPTDCRPVKQVQFFRTQWKLDHLRPLSRLAPLLGKIDIISTQQLRIPGYLYARYRTHKNPIYIRLNISILP